MSSRPDRARALPAALACLAVAAGPAAAVPSAGESIAALNAQRVANGIPGEITENAAWSSGCALHNGWMRRNDRMQHPEDPDTPGYTPEGDQAGQSSVLSGGIGWVGGVNPWENAPIHLMQLLHPWLSVTGASNTDGFACMFTWPGYLRTPSATDVVLSYPGPGRTDVAPAERASEMPFVPGDFVGLPQGTETGPHIYLLADGPFAQSLPYEGGRPFGIPMAVQSATLTGPEGPVEVRTVDNTVPRLGGYLPPGGIVIPVRPLRGNAAYHLSAVLQGQGGATATRELDFRTRGLDNFSRPSYRTARGAVVLRWSARVPATLRIRTPRGLTRTRALPRGRTRVPVTAGRWRLCVSSGGGASQYAPALRCLIVIVDGRLRVRSIRESTTTRG